MSEKFPPRISVMPSMADLLSKGADKKHEVAEIYVHESLLQAEREKVELLRDVVVKLLERKNEEHVRIGQKALAETEEK